jgi:hypothetical protein
MNATELEQGTTCTSASWIASRRPENVEATVASRATVTGDWACFVVNTIQV